MKFSVIVPVYGVEKYLNECVESVLAQTYGDFELILVDDCSPDGCPAMCDEWAKKDSRVRVIHKQVNEGLGFARNTGMDAAQGEYILFLDSDDYINVDTLKLCEENLRDNKDVLVFGMELRYEDAAGNAKWCDLILPEEFYSDTTEKKACMFKQLSSNKVFPYACNKAYRRQFLMSVPVRFEKTKLIEDFLFNIGIFGYANVIGAIPQAFYTYRKPAHETLASRYSPEFFELSKRKYLLEEQFLHSCGALKGEYLHQIHCGYLKHIMSTIIKNRSEAAALRTEQQKERIRTIIEDPLTVRVISQMQPAGVQYKLIHSALRKGNVTLLLTMAIGIEIMQKYMMSVFRKFG